MRIEGTIQTLTEVGNRSTLSILPTQPKANKPAIPANNIVIVINKTDKAKEGFVAGDHVSVDITKVTGR